MGTKEDNFNWAFTEPDTVLDYKIVQGKPSIVESEVKDLLLQDWQPTGKLLQMRVQDTDIVIQCMVLYQKHALC